MRIDFSAICGFAFFLCLGMSVASGQEADIAGLEFFEKKVRPVLVQHCYECHSQGAEELMGSLRLDHRQGLLSGGDSGPAVVPGEPDESPLVQAIRYESFEMPPDGQLPPQVVADLVRWVEMGVPYPEPKAVADTASDSYAQPEDQLWSFEPIRKFQPPSVRDPSWPRDEIDHFILARLESHDLNPVSDANRLTLLRRISFALTGLPPTRDEQQAFLSDDSPEAAARMVDRWLGSPFFGQRWGRHWLDVARFAESSGGGRSQLFHDAWRYRDYVVDSFNSDKQFDNFVREQIAGDLQPADSLEKSREQLTATGFLALGPINYELQDKELLRMEVIDEQIDTLGRAFLGMTIGCARCHNHKFDPIPTADYYALVGIFRSTKSLTPGNVSGWVARPLPLPAAMEETYARHEAATSELEKRIADLQSQLKDLTGQDLETGALSASSLTGVVVDDVDAEIVGDWQRSTSVKSYVGNGYLHDGNVGKGSKWVRFAVRLPEDGEYEVRLSYAPASNRTRQAEIFVSHGEGEATLYLDQSKTPATGAVFASLGRYRFNSDTEAEVTIFNRDSNGYVTADCVQFLPLSMTESAGTALAGRKTRELSEDERKQLREQKASLEELETEMAALKAKSPPARAMVMSVQDHEELGDYRICIRGDAHNLGAVVPRGFLSAADRMEVPSIPDDASGRRELAEWLTSPENPLTARVICNRIWHHLFGAGIVRTTDNFGAMGELPSHPELLDFLAAEFMEDDWSVKRLIRRIMLSRTYQLSSEFDAKAAALDPENRLLWRASRRRLEAEAIRDAMLYTSGELDLGIGGSMFDSELRLEYGYEHDSARRSIYVPVFRNTLLDLFEVFDFADPNMVKGARTVSTLPTQALFMLNSPFVMEEAEAAAGQILANKEIGDDSRVREAFLSILGRPPSREEQQIVNEFLEKTASQNDDEQSETASRHAWTQIYQMLYSSVDFRYVN